MEVTRVVPASGNLAVCGQQFWLGPVHTTCGSFWLAAASLPDPHPSPQVPLSPIEVDRLVTANGLIALAGRQHPIGYHLAGRRITARLEHGVLHILDADRTLLRSLPNPLTRTDLARLRDARPAGPPPAPVRDAQRVDRRVSSRGSVVIAGQRIHPGIAHAGRTVTVEPADTTFRIYAGPSTTWTTPSSLKNPSGSATTAPGIPTPSHLATPHGGFATSTTFDPSPKTPSS